MSAYGASQAGKGSGQSRSLGEVGQMPIKEYRKQLGAMADQQLRNNINFAGQMKNLYPELAREQARVQARAMSQGLRFYPKFTAAERKASSQQREGDLADLASMGQRYADQFAALSPAYAALDKAVNDFTRADLSTTGDFAPTALRQEMDRQALYDLGLGKSLSPEEERMAQQSARAAWSSRGLANSNPALLAEVLSRDSMGTQRQAQRRAFAANTLQLGTEEDRLRQGMRLQAEGSRANALIALNQAKLSPILSATTARTGMNPYGMMAFNQAPSLAEVSGIFGGSPQVQAGASAMQPLYSYGRDVFDTNFNAAESRALNRANAYTSAGAGMMSTAGDMYTSGMKYGSKR